MRKGDAGVAAGGCLAALIVVGLNLLWIAVVVAVIIWVAKTVLGA